MRLPPGSTRTSHSLPYGAASVLRGVRSLEFRGQPADQSLGLFGSALRVERDEAGKDFRVGEISRPAIGLSDEGIDRVVVLADQGDEPAIVNVALGLGERAAFLQGLDRKRTRLNSSH